MKAPTQTLLSGEIVEEQVELTLADLCRVSGLPVEEITVMVEEGIIDPVSGARQWRFHGACLRRVRRAVCLRRDLGVNWAGAALALDLMDELEDLRRRMERTGEP